jgi:hypothetical protein
MKRFLLNRTSRHAGDEIAKVGNLEVYLTNCIALYERLGKLSSMTCRRQIEVT